MKKFTLLALTFALISLYSCKPEPVVEEQKVDTSFQIKIACLSEVGLPNVDLKVEMDDGTAYVLATDAQGSVTFEENPTANCYSLRIEKIAIKPPSPDEDDKSALGAFLQDPASSTFPAMVYDINRDQLVSTADMQKLDEVIGDNDTAPNYPWTFISRDGQVDLTCFTAADFEGTLEIVAYRLSDFDGSDCE